MATLINGNGNNAVYAQQDADLYAGALGESTRILNVGSKLAYTIEDANTIAVADGVILTKEGRRIQVDVGSVDEFIIPTGSAGVTRYYIIGYHLYTDGSANQKCETFVQLMASESETISEAEFREGATEVYVSLYRIKQIGLNLDTITALLSVGIALTDMTDVIGDTDISGIGDGTLTGGLNTVNQNLTELGGIRYNKTTDMVQIQDAVGNWHDWKVGGLLFDGILYNAGAFSSLYPMSPVTSRTSSSQIASVTLNSANIKFEASTVSSPSTNNAVADIVTDAPIDMTGFTTLKVQVASLNGNNARMGISANNSSTPSYEAGITIHATGLQTVDISAITGEHYVRVGADESTGAGTVKQTTFTVTKIWLE